MDKEIEIRYFHNNGEVYRPNGDYFNREHLNSITNSILEEYTTFQEKIINEGGYIELHLGHLENGSISYQPFIKGVSDSLGEELSRWESQRT